MHCHAASPLASLLKKSVFMPSICLCQSWFAASSSSFFDLVTIAVCVTISIVRAMCVYECDKEWSRNAESIRWSCRSLMY
jgi:hypothetical protein